VAILWDRFQSGGSGCSAAKALTGIEPNSLSRAGFEKKRGDFGKNLFGNISFKKNISRGEPPNRRSLHYAAPDFLWRAVALMICMRLSLRRAAHVLVARSAK
jgi:hypothetical protein